METTTEAPRRGRPPKTPEYLETHAHIGESFQEFEIRVLAAQPGDWVETTEDNIKKLNPLGLGGQKFFTYKNVKVCKIGDFKEIEKALKLEMEEAIFGKPNMSPESTPVNLQGASKT